jgi:hypothetical protein
VLLTLRSSCIAGCVGGWGWWGGVTQLPTAVCSMPQVAPVLADNLSCRQPPQPSRHAAHGGFNPHQARHHAHTHLINAVYERRALLHQIRMLLAARKLLDLGQGIDDQLSRGLLARHGCCEGACVRVRARSLVEPATNAALLVRRPSGTPGGLLHEAAVHLASRQLRACSGCGAPTDTTVPPSPNCTFGQRGASGAVLGVMHLLDPGTHRCAYAGGCGC